MSQDYKARILPIALLTFSFFYFLFFSRFDIIPGDEGYFDLVCFRILHGQLPYKDFFLHTPPLSYFIQTVIFKLFGEGLIVGRLTMVFMGTFICALLYFISSRLAKQPFSLMPSLIFLFLGVSHIPYPVFNWYGLFISLLVILFVFRYTDSGNKNNLFIAGFFAGCLMLTKQNLGASAIISLFAYLTIEAIFNLLKMKNDIVSVIKQLAKDCLYVFIGGLLPILTTIIFFYTNNALKQFIFYMFNFSYESLRMRMEIFPFPHLKIVSFIILGIFFWLGFLLYNVTINKKYKKLFTISLSAVLLGLLAYRFASKEAIYYIDDHINEGILNGFFNLPALSIISAFVFLLRKILIRRIDKLDICLAFIAIFSFSYIWFGLILSRDLIHLIPTMPIAYPIFAFFIEKLYTIYDSRIGGNKSILTGYLFIFPIAFFCFYGFIVNINNETFKSSSSKIFNMKYQMKIKNARFLIVDRHKGVSIEKLVEYIKNNTKSKEKIFLFWVDSTPYILAGRIPATFNTLFIPDAFRLKDQSRVIDELMSNDPRLVICDYNPTLTASGFQRGEVTAQIEKFIHDKYIIQKKIGPYYILVKK